MRGLRPKSHFKPLFKKEGIMTIQFVYILDRLMNAHKKV